MIAEDFVGDDVAGDEAHDDFGAGNRAAAILTRACFIALGTGQAQQRHEGIVGTRLGEVPSEQPDQAVEVAVQRGVAVHLDAQILYHRDALGLGDAFGGAAQ